MINRVVKIKNCPSFLDFTPAPDLPDFLRFNLIYGWNGSGKTSFSRVLRCFELGKCCYENSNFCPEFELKMSDGATINQDNLSSFTQIRVFNKDFIEENVFCEGGIKPIFYLGKASKDASDKISQLENELEILSKNLKIKRLELEKIQDKKSKELSNKARDIKTNLTTSGSDFYRNYERPELEKSLDANKDILQKTSMKNLSDNQLILLKKSIIQTSKATVNDIETPNLNLSELEAKVRKVIQKSVISKVIEELKRNPELSKWVEEGLLMHKHKKLSNCAFCNQRIPSDRITELEKHFNDEYQNTINLIKELKVECNSRKIVIQFPDPSNLYDDLAPEFKSAREDAEGTISDFHTKLDMLLKVLDEKEQNLFSLPKLGIIKPVDQSTFTKIKELIKKHNDKTTDFENQIKDSKKQLELHYLSEFWPSYITTEKECQVLQEEVVSFELEVKEKNANLDSEKQSLLSNQIPLQKINSDLEHFLGRKDITLKALDEENGYQVIRNGVVAENLSEGEKTALAIIYFLAKIQEDGFDIKHGIIVMDDPVSSLDSNAIFQAFSFIKESIKEAEQIIILTHHFDFFRQVKNWFKHYRGEQCSYYMIVCCEESGCRHSSLIKIDELLTRYESEYHFLFSLLYRLVEKNEINLEKLYSIPNVARKFLESFLAFRVPVISRDSEPDMFARLGKIEFDSKKKVRIQRFVDTHSHPRYERGVQDFDMTILGEAQDIVKDLLMLVQTEDTKHYNFLVESVSA